MSNEGFDFMAPHFPADRRAAPPLRARLSEALGGARRARGGLARAGAAAAGGLGLAAGVLALAPKMAMAAAEGEKLHLGHKIANALRSKGLTDEMIVMLISAIPAVELRGSIPVGAWLGLPAAKTFALAVAGNMAPIVVLLALLKSQKFVQLMDPLLRRAKEKSKGLGSEGQKELALATFVGIPLPGTGAWTGAFVSLLLDMGFRASTVTITAGVMAAGAIVSVLTYGTKAAVTRAGAGAGGPAVAAAATAALAAAARRC